ncbi:MAG: glycosyltransferase 87 family protein [Anaerolineales bacterium]|nr:glycosyltransferase 87 family protein [Anaerolineales bacterium]
MKSKFSLIKKTGFLLVQGLAISLLTIIAIGTWLSTLKPQLFPGGVDYLAYYSAGYIVKFVNPTQIYNLDLQWQVQTNIVNVNELLRFYPYNHPPMYIGILKLTITRSYTTSFIRWIIILMIFHVLATIFLARLLHYLKFSNHHIWMFSIASILFLPIHAAYVRGQDTTFLLLGVSLWAFGLLTDKDKISGLGLVLTMIRPQIALALLIPSIFKKKSMFKWVLLTSLLFFLLNFPLIKLQGIKDFLHVLIISGQGYGFDVDKMSTLMGALLRWKPDINPDLWHLIGYGAYLLMIVIISIIWKRKKHITINLIGITILTIMFFSPHLHSHDFSLLLIPIIATMNTLKCNKRFDENTILLIPFFISLLLTFTYFIWPQTIVYMIIFAQLIILIVPQTSKSSLTGKTKKLVG